jgi:hypothetical protein
MDISRNRNGNKTERLENPNSCIILLYNTILSRINVMKDCTLKLYCNDCNKQHTLKFEFVSDLFSLKCPECSSEDIFFQDIISPNSIKEDTIVLGKGGRGRCG